MLFLQAINNILFDEQKLTALWSALVMLECFSMTSRENVPLCMFAERIWSSAWWAHPPLPSKGKQHGCFALQLIILCRALIGSSVKFIVSTGGTWPQDKTDNKDKLRKDFIAYFGACYLCKCLQTKTSFRMIGNKLNFHCTQWLQRAVQRLPQTRPYLAQVSLRAIADRLWPFGAKYE